MTVDLQAHLKELEAEFAVAEKQRLDLHRQWEGLRKRLEPIEEEMIKLEAAMDEIRLHPRYKELSEQLPHLRKAVGK